VGTPRETEPAEETDAGNGGTGPVRSGGH